MRKKNFKGRCEKRKISKCAEVCRTYDAIQYAYADLLQASDEVKEIRCNVLLDGLEVGEYTSDFVCTKVDGDLMVRECIFRKFLMKPLTVKLLDVSREYFCTQRYSRASVPNGFVMRNVRLYTETSNLFLFSRVNPAAVSEKKKQKWVCRGAFPFAPRRAPYF